MLCLDPFPVGQGKLAVHWGAAALGREEGQWHAQHGAVLTRGKATQGPLPGPELCSRSGSRTPVGSRNTGETEHVEPAPLATLSGRGSWEGGKL